MSIHTSSTTVINDQDGPTQIRVRDLAGHPGMLSVHIGDPFGHGLSVVVDVAFAARLAAALTAQTLVAVA